MRKKTTKMMRDISTHLVLQLLQKSQCKGGQSEWLQPGSQRRRDGDVVGKHLGTKAAY